MNKCNSNRNYIRHREWQDRMKKKRNNKNKFKIKILSNLSKEMLHHRIKRELIKNLEKLCQMQFIMG